MDESNKRFQGIVHGLVQGVGFRWYVRQGARRLCIRGYVRNLPDRTVEIIAEGPERALDEFLSYLQTGSSPAIIDRLDVNWLPASGRYSGFEVRF